MIIINPWTYYQIHEPDKIPDLNPLDDEEMVGCLAGGCGFIVSSIIFTLITYLLFSITENGYINIHLLPFLMFANCVVIYPILMICLMNLSFKIVDKIYKKKRKQ